MKPICCNITFSALFTSVVSSLRSRTNPQKRPTMKHTILQVVLGLALFGTTLGQLNIIRDLLQFNLAGHPVLHKDAEWAFDPEVGARRSRQYQALNGRYGANSIERLGLGIDGYDQERLAAQKERDEGQLNGATEQ